MFKLSGIPPVPLSSFRFLLTRVAAPQVILPVLVCNPTRVDSVLAAPARPACPQALELGDPSAEGRPLFLRTEAARTRREARLLDSRVIVKDGMTFCPREDQIYPS